MTLLGEKVRFVIPLYSDESVGLDFLPSRPVRTYQGLKEFNHILIHFGNLFGRLEEIGNRVTDLHIIFPQNQERKINAIARETATIVKAIKESKTIKPETALRYRQLLRQLALIVKSTIDKKEEYPYTFVPLRGGSHVVSSFGIDFDSMIAIDCKRIPLEDGSFAFGMHSPVFDPYDLDRIHKRKLRVVEVCIASGITSAGILLDLFIKGCVPKTVTFQILFASKQGLSFVKKVAEALDIDVCFYVGKLYNGLGSLVTSNDSIVDEHGKAVLGNATKILDVAEKS